MRKLCLVALLAGLSLAGRAEAVSWHDGVLGRDGTLYQVAGGTYGELFARPQAANAAEPVLALRAQASDGSVTLHLVPETDGPDVESAAFLAYEEASDTVFVTWEQRTNLIHSQTKLAGLSEGAWSEPIRVSDARLSLKEAPRLVVTRDSYSGSGDDAPAISRTVLHLVWLEERGEGLLVVYAPVVLLDGRYTGGHTVYVLADAVGEEAPAALGEVPVLPVLAEGDNGHSVVAGFVDARTHRLVTMRVTLLPGEYAALADDLRRVVIETGGDYDLAEPDEVRRLADDLGSHIIDIGARFDGRIVRHIAADLGSHIIDIGARYAPRDVRRLAGDLGSHIIDIGFRLEHRGLRSAVASSQVLELLPEAQREGEAAIPAQVAQLGQVTSRALPVNLPQDVDALYLSQNGQQALVAWKVGGALVYRETRDGGWSPAERLVLGPQLSLAQAHQVLRERTRRR